MKQQRVVCSALRATDGTLILGARHFDSLMREQIQANVALVDYHDNWEQGFIDQHGMFLTREHAWEVAKAAGQILQRVGGDAQNGGTLYSENLY